LPIPERKKARFTVSKGEDQLRGNHAGREYNSTGRITLTQAITENA